MKTLIFKKSVLAVALAMAPVFLRADTDYLGGNATLINLTRVNSDLNNANQAIFSSNANVGILDWSKFNIGAEQKMEFQTTVKTTFFNLVNGSTEKSQIDGIISGEGNVWVINPNGVAFGANAKVNVGGFFAAAAATLTNADALRSSDDAGAKPIFGAMSGKIEAANVVDGNKAAFEAKQVVLMGRNVALDADVSKVQYLTVGAANNFEFDVVEGGRVTLNFKSGELGTDTSDIGIELNNLKLSPDNAMLEAISEATVNLNSIDVNGDALIASSGDLKVNDIKARDVVLVSNGDVTSDSDKVIDVASLNVATEQSIALNGKVKVNTVSAFIGYEVTLDNEANTFGGAVSAIGNEISLTADKDIELGAVFGNVVEIESINGNIVSDSENGILIASDSLSLSAKQNSIDLKGFVGTDSGSTASFIARQDVIANNNSNDLSGAITVTAESGAAVSGKVNLVSASDITIDTIKAASDTTLEATGVNAGTIESGSLSINSGMNGVSLNDAVQTTGAVDIRSTGSVTGTGTVTAGVSLMVNSESGNIALTGKVKTIDTAQFTASNTIEVSNTENEFGGAVSLNGKNGATLKANGALELGEVLSEDGAVSIITTGGDVTGTETVTSDGNLMVYSHDGKIALTGKVEADTAQFTAYNTIEVSNTENEFGGTVSLNGGNGATLNASGDLKLGEVSSAHGAVSITATGDITDSQYINANKDLTIASSGGAIDLSHSVAVIESGKTEFQAKNSIKVSSDDNIFDGTVAAKSDTGNVELHAEKSLTLANISAENGNVTVKSGEAITSAATDTIVAQKLAVEAADKIELNGVVTTAGTASFSTSGEAKTISVNNAANAFGGAVSANGDTITLAAANDIELAEVVGKVVEIESINGKIVSYSENGQLVAVDSLALSANKESIELEGVVQVNENGTASFIAGQNVIVNNESNDLSGAVTVTADGGKVNLVSAGNLTIATVKTTGETELEARGVNAGTIESGKLLVNAGANGVSLNDAVTTTENLVIVATGDVTGTETGTLTAGGPLTVYSDTGKIDLAGKVVASDVTRFEAKQTAVSNTANTFADAVSLIGEDGATLNVGGDLKLGEVSSANGAVSITATGDITDSQSIKTKTDLTIASSGGAIDLSHDLDVEGNAEFNASKSIKASSDANAFVGTVAAKSDNGDVELHAANSLKLANISAENGNVTVKSGEAVTSTATDAIVAKNLEVEAANDIALDGVVTTTETAKFTSGEANTIRVDNADNAFGGKVTLGKSAGAKIKADSDIELDTVESTGKVEVYSVNGAVKSTEQITVNELAVTTSGGDIELSGPITTTGDATFSAHGNTANVSVDNSANSFGGKVYAQGDSVILSSGSDLKLANISADSMASISTASGDVLADANANIAAGTLEVVANDGSINLNGKIVTTGDVNFQVGATEGNSTTVDNVENSFGGKVSIYGYDSVTLVAKDTIDIAGAGANDQLSIKSVSGDVIDGDTVQIDAKNLKIEATAGNIELSGKTIAFNDAEFVAGKKITVVNDGNILNGQLTVIGADGATVKTDSVLTLAKVESAGDVKLESASYVQDIDGATIDAGKLEVIATGGDIVLNGKVAVTGETSFEALDKVRVVGQNNRFGDKVSASAPNGVALRSADDVEIGTITTTGNVLLESVNGDVKFGTALAGDNISVLAGGDIKQNADITANGSVDMQAAGAIDSAVGTKTTAKGNIFYVGHGGVINSEISATDSGSAVYVQGVGLADGVTLVSGDTIALDVNSLGTMDGGGVNLSAAKIAVQTANGDININNDRDLEIAKLNTTTDVKVNRVDDYLSTYEHAPETDSIEINGLQAGNGGVKVNNTGSITGSADINGSSVELIAQSGSIAIDGQITSGGDAVFTAADTVKVINNANSFAGTVEVYAYNGAAVVANDNLKLAAVTTDGNLLAQSNNGNVILTGDIAANNVSILAEGYNGGIEQQGDINAAGSVELSAQSTLNMAAGKTTTAVGNINYVSDNGNIQGKFEATGDGSVILLKGDSVNNLELTADAVALSLNSADNLTLNAGKLAANIDNGTLKANFNRDLEIGDISAAESAVSRVATDLTVADHAAEGVGDLSGITQHGNGGVELDPTASGLKYTQNSAINADGYVGVYGGTANCDITVNADTISHYSNVDYIGNAKIEVNGAKIQSENSSVAIVGETVKMGAGTEIAANYEARIAATPKSDTDKSIDIENAKISSAQDKVFIHSNGYAGDINIVDTEIKAGGDDSVIMNSNGDIVLNNVDATTGSLEISALNNDIEMSGNYDVTGSLEVMSGGDLTMTDGTEVNVTGNAAIFALDDFIAASVNSAGSMVIDADTFTQTASSQVDARQLGIHLRHDSLGTSSDPFRTKANTVAVNVSGDVNLTMTRTAKVGTVSAGGLSVSGIQSGKNLNLQTSGDLTVGDGSVVSASGSNRISVSGNLVVEKGGVIKGSTIDATAGGDIMQNDSAVEIQNGYADRKLLNPAFDGENVRLTAGGNIGKKNSGFVAVSANAVSAKAGRNLALAAAKGRDLKIDSAGLSAGGNVDLYTTGTIRPNGAISSGGAITVNSEDFSGGIVRTTGGASLVTDNEQPGAAVIGIYNTSGFEPQVVNQPNNAIVFVNGRLAGGDVREINQLGSLEAFPVQTPELKSEQGIFGNPVFLHDELDVANPLAVGAIDFLIAETPRLTLSSDFPVEIDKQVAAVGLNPTTSYWFGQHPQEEAVDENEDEEETSAE